MAHGKTDADRLHDANAHATADINADAGSYCHADTDPDADTDANTHAARRVSLCALVCVHGRGY